MTSVPKPENPYQFHIDYPLKLWIVTRKCVASITRIAYFYFNYFSQKNICINYIFKTEN